MKKYILVLLLVLALFTVQGQQSYYNDVDLTLSGIPLKNALATKIISTHSNNLSYNGAKAALKIIDLEPGQNNNVLLLYGFSTGLCPSSSSSDNDHRRRSKYDFGGGASCEWNREHTYPKSLGTPNLGQSGPGADVHHLRACDVQRNGNRGSKKFSNGSGNSGSVGSYWYPGDEWKGDVARMMMYMYLRYGNQCLPKNVGTGATVANDNNMISLFLQWNVDDPVSTYEATRNTYLSTNSNQYSQGNRNPFIDNPYLATLIWGGADAEDLWGIYVGTADYTISKQVTIYPNPAITNISIDTNLVLSKIIIYNYLGQKVLSTTNTETVDVSTLNQGLYFMKLIDDKGKYGMRKFIKKASN